MGRAPVGISLRGSVGAAVIVLSTLLALTAGALVLVTSLLDKTARALANDVEAVRVAEGLEVDLLVYHRLHGLTAQLEGAGPYIGGPGAIERQLHERLDEAARYVNDPYEAALL